MRRDSSGKLISYSKIENDVLIVAGTIVDGMDFRLEEILDRYDAKIDNVVWQSSVNYYISYDYEPFTTDLFLRKFTVKGDIKFLTWLNDKVNNYLQSQELAERCFAAKAVLPGHEISFKID